MSGNVLAEGNVTREDSKGFPIEVTKDSLEGKVLFSKQNNKLGQKAAETGTGACLNSLGFPIPPGNTHFGNSVPLLKFGHSSPLLILMCLTGA